MTHPMIEEAARAICEAERIDPDRLTPYSHDTEMMWQQFIPHALIACRIAIKACQKKARGNPYGHRYRTWDFWPDLEHGARPNRDNEDPIVVHADAIADELRALSEQIGTE